MTETSEASMLMRGSASVRDGSVSRVRAFGHNPVLPCEGVALRGSERQGPAGGRDSRESPPLPAAGVMPPVARPVCPCPRVPSDSPQQLHSKVRP